MLKITNESDEQDFILTARETRTGRDGEAVTLEPGQTATIEIDGDHQLVAAPGGGRKPDEAAALEIPVATVEGKSTRAPTDADSKPAGEVLPDADDDAVRAEINDMVTTKTNLTKGGSPELPVLNERLKARGFAPVNAERRDALMPQPA
jgi:hypothetical protein